MNPETGSDPSTGETAPSNELQREPGTHVHEVPGAELWLGADGVLRQRFVTSAVQEAISSFAEALDELSPGKRCPMVADIRELRFVARGVRMAGSDDRVRERISAVAVVVSNPVTRVFGSVAARLADPTMPIRVFASCGEAEAWAKTFTSPSPLTVRDG